MYDGSNYSGWAKQNNDDIKTIQNEIELTLSNIFQTKINIFASGRTDKYVHAIDQCFNFKVDTKIPIKAIKKMCDIKLPKDIYIKKIDKVNNTFHARFSIKSKTYLYKVNIGNLNIFEKDYVYQYNKDININKLKKIINLFIGEKDFLSFSTSEVENTVREITKLNISKKNNYVFFKITGNGFLRNMVRMIVGVFLNYNENKITIEEIKLLFDNPSKGKAIIKAPGCGLYLYKTNY